MSKSYKDKTIPIAVSRQISQQHPSILDLERINTRTFSDLGPKTTSDDEEPFTKPVMNRLDPIEELYDMYSEEEDTPRIVEIEDDDGLDFVSDVEGPADPYMDL